MAIKERGETPFEQAGDGIVLCFSYADFKKLDGLYKVGWMNRLTQSLLSGNFDFEQMETIFRVGAKRDGKPVPDLAVPAMPFTEFGDRVMDALSMSMHGKTFKAFLEEVAAQMAAADEGGQPRPQ